jgi:hypothetical protein
MKHTGRFGAWEQFEVFERDPSPGLKLKEG